MITPPPSRFWRRCLGRLVRWLMVLLIGYVGALIVLLFLENKFVYHPSGPDEWMPSPSPRITDVELVSAAGDKIHGWWYGRQGSAGALLYFHGNGGNLSGRGNFVFVMGEYLDVSVLIIDYPGYGKSSGRPSEAGCYAAGDAAYEWLTKAQGIPGATILLYGASLGGGVAVDLASRMPHRALILVKTFTSVPDVGQGRMPWFPVRWLMRNRFDSMSKLALCKQPTFVTHGDADSIIPFAHGQQLYDAAPGPKEFLRLPGQDHNDMLPKEFFVRLKSFLTANAPLAVPVPQ